MRPVFLLLLALALTSVSCRAFDQKTQGSRVLFVGNSLTYVGNLPAVFSALAEANGKPTRADMIVRGGATLHQRVADGSVARALDERSYTALVLQERGGDLMGSFGPDAAAASRKAIADLAQLATARGIKVVLLGSYQALPAASERLIQGEATAALNAGIPYVAVSERLQRMLRVAPELTWFAPDGVHPGSDLTLLNGVLVYQTLLGSLPKPEALHVKAPIYGTRSGLKEVLQASDSPPPLAETPLEIRYSAETTTKVLQAVGDASGS